jgi:hypothetical protein
MPERLEDVLVEGGATVAPPEPPAAEPAPVSPPEPEAELSLEQLLAQFDQETASTAPAATPDPLETQEPAAPVVNGDGGFQEAYQRELWYQNERVALEEYCGKLQEKLGDTLDAKSEIIAMSVQDPRLEVAWQARNHDPAAIRAELTKAEAALRQMQMFPNVDPKLVADQKHWLWQLQVAANAKDIIWQAERAVIKKAHARKPVDQDASEDRAAVVAAVRGASDAHPPADPPPNFAYMSDQELREYTRKNFGF